MVFLFLACYVKHDTPVIPVEGKSMVLEFFARELKDKALAAQCGELAKRVRAVSGGIRDLAEKKIQDIVSSCSRGSSSLGLLENKKATEDEVRAEFAALAAKSPDAEADALIEKASADKLYFEDRARPCVSPVSRPLSLVS